MREIKFRAWDKEFKKFSENTLKYSIEDIGYLTDYEWSQYTGLNDKNGREIYEDDIVKIVTNEKVGENKHGSGRSSYTTAVYRDIESIGVVKYGKCNYPFDKVSTYYVDTNNNVQYDTYFYADKPSDGTTRINNIIKRPIEIINDIQVIGNIYANSDLIE